MPHNNNRFLIICLLIVSFAGTHPGASAFQPPHASLGAGAFQPPYASLGAGAFQPPHPSLGAGAFQPPHPSPEAVSGRSSAPFAPSSQKKSSTRKKSTTKKQNTKPSTQKKSSAPQTSRPSAQKKSSAPKTSKEAKQRQEETQREIARTKEQIRLNEQQMKEGLSDLNRLSADIESGRKDVARLQGKVASLQGEIGSLNSKITEGQKELDRMRGEYLKAIKKMRLTKKNQSTLAFIFASEDFNQAMRRIRYLRQFSEWKDRQSANINAQIKTLAEEKERLDKTKQQETAALAQLESSQRTLESKHREQANIVGKLKANGDMLQGHLRAKQSEANSLKESISRLIAEEQAKAEAERKAREKAEADRKAREKAEADRIAREKAADVGTHPGASAQTEAEKKAAEKKAADEKKKAAEEKKKEDKKKAQEKKAAEKKQKNSEKSSRRKKKTSDSAGTHPGAADTESPAETPSTNVGTHQGASVDKRLGSSFAASKGSLPRPVDGGWRITNPFGRHSMPEMPEVVYDNPGIDAEVATGSSAKAVYAGRVSGVYKVAGYGTVVIVNHGEYYTVYGNLSSASVSVGSQVKPGQTLGKVGPDPDDPRHSSIHFEVWHGRDKQNPAAWLR